MAKSIDSISKKKKKGDSLPEQPVQEKAEVSEQKVENSADKQVEAVTPTESTDSVEPTTQPSESAATTEAESAESPAATESTESTETKPATEDVPPTTEVAPVAATPDAIPTPTGVPQATTSTPASDDDSFEKLFPEPSVIVDGPPTWVWWVLLVLGAAVLGFLAFDVTRQRIDTWLQISSPSPSPSADASATASPTATESPTPTPTPTPTATAEVTTKDKITLRVLNGTTIAGAAGTAANTLTKAGFTIRTTGNAKNQTYTSTYIYHQVGKKAEAELVAAALASYKPLVQESTLADPDMILVVVAK